MIIANRYFIQHYLPRSHLNRGRLEGLVAEHLDHLYYINDIISLGVDCLNEVLCDHLLNRLIIPLYVYSLTDENMMPDGVRTKQIVSFPDCLSPKII